MSKGRASTHAAQVNTCLNRRSRHLLFAKIAVDAVRNRGALPKSSSIALAANVHPATARRWLADLRRILPLRASDLRAGRQP